MALVPVGSNPRWRLAAILKISNGHISETGHPIAFVFGSRVGVDPQIFVAVGVKNTPFPLNVCQWYMHIIRQNLVSSPQSHCTLHLNLVYIAK